MKSKFLPAVFALSLCASAGADVPPIRKAPEKEKVEVAIDSPATNYRISIREIRKVGEELWVLSEVSTVGDFGGAAITTIRDEVSIATTGLPHKHFVIGKTWGWAEPKTVTYLEAGAEMDEKWKDGKVLFARRRQPGEEGGDKR